ncbi:hypothetical protein [Streptomyces sp. NPDC056308]|uniref:hypothetical protein n=1 Tax=Streptomyces sp. NPDC056308 TaxID=3345780 RepID=UPI0035DC37CA
MTAHVLARGQAVAVWWRNADRAWWPPRVVGWGARSRSASRRSASVISDPYTCQAPGSVSVPRSISPVIIVCHAAASSMARRSRSRASSSAGPSAGPGVAKYVTAPPAASRVAA